MERWGAMPSKRAGRAGVRERRELQAQIADWARWLLAWRNVDLLYSLLREL